MIELSTHIWSALPLPGFILGPDNRVVGVNPSAEQFVNKTARALTGARIWDRLTIDTTLSDALARARKNQSGVVVNDVDVIAPGKSPVQSNILISPLDEATETVLVLISPREIADRLGRAQSSKSAAKSAIGMAEMLAHEIKNPLAGITGAAQLLSMNLKDDDLELTDLIVAESRRIVKLLEQVEQFGNLRPPARRAVNIHDLLDRSRRSASVGFARDFRVVEDYDPSLPPTFADGDQLVQVFLNLLKNAAEAMASSGSGDTIGLRSFYDRSLRRVRPDGTSVPVPLQVEIWDNGPGLPEEIAGEVFDPFISGKENGTGLGLALVSKIISEHDGLVGVDSSPGKTIFRLSLPVAPKQPNEPEQAS